MARAAAFWLLGGVLAAPAAPAETIWLRGRGADVWIERDGRVQEPQKDRKGFTRVATPRPRRPRVAATPPVHRPHSHGGGVVIGPAYRSDGWRPYEPAVRRTYRHSVHPKRHGRHAHRGHARLHHGRPHHAKSHVGPHRSHHVYGHRGKAFRSHGKPHFRGRSFGGGHRRHR
jgi:hypothetical protein